MELFIGILIGLAIACLTAIVVRLKERPRLNARSIDVDLLCRSVEKSLQLLGLNGHLEFDGKKLTYREGDLRFLFEKEVGCPLKLDGYVNGKLVFQSHALDINDPETFVDLFHSIFSANSQKECAL